MPAATHCASRHAHVQRHRRRIRSKVTSEGLKRQARAGKLLSDGAAAELPVEGAGKRDSMGGRNHRETIEALQPPHANVSAVKLVLSSLLDDPTFMPEGGMLGFRLRHDYPLPKASWTHGIECPLTSLKAWLKGSDAALSQACTELGVQPLLRLSLGIVSSMRRRGDVVLNSFTFTGDAEDPWSPDMEYNGAYGEDEADEEDSEGLAVHWFTEGGYKDGPRSAYAAYGNEASLDWLYTTVGLVLVKISPLREGSVAGVSTTTPIQGGEAPQIRLELPGEKPKPRPASLMQVCAYTRTAPVAVALPKLAQTQPIGERGLEVFHGELMKATENGMKTTPSIGHPWMTTTNHSRSAFEAEDDVTADLEHFCCNAIISNVHCPT
ncbi:hypothetical protein LXA43DRAFT_1063732 [Ganoderma leucocontextum]|nr:hypothetical protein LXA43DRAFT_1063732 [Ganoderma leucocontextum]